MFHDAISMLHQEDNGNIILHQIISDGSLLSIQETKPLFLDSSISKTLVLDKNEISWAPYFKFEDTPSIIISNNNGTLSLDASVDTRVIIDQRLKGTNIYYSDDRIGIGRGPLFTYKFDIAVPENTLMTAFHVGDGKYGFSMGNGTAQGFIPEIIGMGSDENDAGLYLIGRAGNNEPSSIPLVIIDGRNYKHQKVENRPLFGITNAEYDNYKFLIDQEGKVNATGEVHATDFVLDSSISVSELVRIIIEQKSEIDILKDRITKLEEASE
jgi:hypothetical protein